MPKRRLTSPDLSFPKIFSRDMKEISISIHSKSGLEEFTLKEDFTGSIGLEFNKGGLSGVYNKEKLK